MTQAGSQEASPILFFDGMCGLCDRFVSFLVSHDRHHHLRFAPLQGKTAKVRLDPQVIESLETVVLRRGDKTFTRSTAALEAVAILGGMWRLCRILHLVPKPLRDVVYMAVARYRYRLFGRRDSCRLPSAIEKPYFLD